MVNHIAKNFTGRLKFVQLVLLLTLSCNAMADSILAKFNPNYRIQHRGPQSFTPDVEYVPTPERKKIWLEYILVEDDAGVLVGVRNNLKRWEEKSNYVKNWNLESTGQYSVKSYEARREYLNGIILKYVDKRLSGEVKKADKGSTLAAVGQAQKALKPQTNVSVSKNIKIKVKARVLQGLAVLKVVNPYVDYHATVSIGGDVDMEMKKEFKETRSIASINYKPTESSYVARIDQGITTNVKARVSSSQSSSHLVFSDDSNSTVQFIYSRPFNF